MNKKLLLVLFITYAFSIPIFGQIKYWYGNVDRNDRNITVYYFKDFKSFEEATGTEVGSLLNWVQLNDFMPTHSRVIFNTMIQNDFVAAFFALDPYDDPRHGRMMYEYTFYILPRGPYGTKYTFMPYLSRQINFPR